jgi:hypothetical protein
LKKASVMKNIFLYIAIVTMISFNSFSQKVRNTQAYNETKVDQKRADTLIETKSTSKKIIRSYLVVENINMKFGAYTTTYEVSDLNLIKIYNLGPNNTRIITPLYDDKNSNPVN